MDQGAACNGLGCDRSIVDPQGVVGAIAACLLVFAFAKTDWIRSPSLSMSMATEGFTRRPWELKRRNRPGAMSAVDTDAKLASNPTNGRDRAMRAPYAKKWRKEIDNLRKIVLACDLAEEVNWGKPCFTYHGKNLAIIIPLKDACALSFLKGVLLKDPKHILTKIGEHTQAGRWIKFTSPQEILALQPTLRSYIDEAIQVEESGRKISQTTASAYLVPEELQVRLNAASELKAAFDALTPGRRKSYIFHVSGAKQAKTRAARAEKCVPMILSGRGFNEFTD